MPDPQDERFSRRAVESGLATPKQLQKCHALQRKLKLQGKNLSLSTIAMKAGILEPEQVRDLLKAPEKKAPSRGRPRGAGRPARPASPKKASNRTLWMIVGASAGAAIFIAALVLVLMPGEDSPSKPPPDVVAKKPGKPAPPTPKRDKAPKPKPVKELTEEDRFLERLQKRRTAGLFRLEEAKLERAKERRKVQAAAEARDRRLAGRPIDLTLRDSTRLRGLIISRHTFHEVEAGTRHLKWDDVEPDSILAASKIIYDPKDADMQFECGRFLVMRRMWKPALEAFKRARTLDNSYVDEVEKYLDLLDSLDDGDLSFRGAARRFARDGILLRYDLHDAEQAKDFEPAPTSAKRSAVFEAGEQPYIFVGMDPDENPHVFVEELAVRATVEADGPVTLLLFTATNLPGYELAMESDGCALFRVHGEERRQIGERSKVGLPPGKKVFIRMQARRRKFTLRIGKEEALSVEDPPESANAPPMVGLLGIRVEKGALTVHSTLLIRGRMAPRDLDRRMGNLEVLLRRALHPNLAESEERALLLKAYSDQWNKKVRFTLSADDSYLTLQRINKSQDLTEYEHLKRDLLGMLEVPGVPFLQKPFEEGATRLDRLIQAYPDVPSLYYLRARVHSERQERTEALKDVKRALALFPEFAEALVLRASMERPDKGMKTLAEALKAVPDYPPAHFLKAALKFHSDPSAKESYLEDVELALHLALAEGRLPKPPKYPFDVLDPMISEARSMLRLLSVQAEGPRDLGCRFDVETQHYRVTTDISDEATQRYAQRLEAGFDRFEEYFGALRKWKSPSKPRVAIFASPESYYTYNQLNSGVRAEATLGLFRPSLNELILFESPDAEGTLHTLHHEAFHQYMTLLIPHTPPYWYNEGVAEYMGSIAHKGRQGTTLEGRLIGIRLALIADLAQPFKEIMCATPRQFYDRMAGLRYAQGWSMVHFFYEYKGGKYRPLIENYFKTLLEGKSPLGAYNAVFKPTAAKLETEWKAYVTGLRKKK